MDGINKEQTGQDMMAIRKKIGKTTYEVTLHFSSTSTENPYDKLKRIILNNCTDRNSSDTLTVL